MTGKIPEEGENKEGEEETLWRNTYQRFWRTFYSRISLWQVAAAAAPGTGKLTTFFTEPLLRGGGPSFRLKRKIKKIGSRLFCNMALLMSLLEV
jgi:hypothetical protein